MHACACAGGVGQREGRWDARGVCPPPSMPACHRTVPPGSPGPCQPACPKGLCSRAKKNTQDTNPPSSEVAHTHPSQPEPSGPSLPRTLKRSTQSTTSFSDDRSHCRTVTWAVGWLSRTARAAISPVSTLLHASTTWAPRLHRAAVTSSAKADVPPRQHTVGLGTGLGGVGCRAWCCTHQL